MECPLCGWPIKISREWETHNKLCAIWECKECNTTVTAQTPMADVKAFKNKYDEGGRRRGEASTGSN